MTAPSPPPPTDKELKDGRYTLLRRLGEGSQGETFEARDNGVRRERPRPEALADEFRRYVTRARAGEPPLAAPGAVVAIKCFRVGKAKAWKDVELAEREARTLASLDHPRLPKYIEHFEEDGALYLVMEKIEGESLAEIRSRQQTLGVAEVTRMLEDISDALRYLHGRAPFIVHRDVKPGNVIRRPDGSYALVDFGAVRDRLKPAGGSTVVGTFGYMAPEQFQGRASPKSDVYGLGATAIAMLTGAEPEELPHEGLGINVARALPKGTPPALVRALGAMLKPDPDRRVDSVDDALAFLRARAEPPKEPAVADAPSKALSRREKRENRRRRKREAREEKRRAREAARERRPPLVPRLGAQLGLLVALVVVWLTVGLLVPLVLSLLSLLFGKALRRAASASLRAAKRSQAALGRASAWVSGHREEQPTEDMARVRVSSELARVRSVTEHEAQAIAIARAEARGEDADAWIEAQLASDAERAELDEEPPRRRSAAPPRAKRRD
ncbi:MAG: serine/threonine protein kinase [Labilithrix sp.]|nr:serine/threonine protein kinase [Labilithrix sp.]